MCWTTFKKENLQKKTAKRDIKVIKILLETADGEFRSPYRLTKYRIKKVYGSEIRRPYQYYSENMWSISEGLHSYSTEIRFVADDDSLRINIMPPNDAITTLDYWHHFSNAVIFKGVIPKGSEYYENERGEIVSTKLKVVSVIADIDRDLVSSSDKVQALNERIHNL